MAENLRITTPVPTSDSLIKPNSAAGSPAVDAVDPTHVTKTSTQEQNTNSQSMDLLLSGESVFGKFIEQLRSTPALSQTLGKVFFDLARRQAVLPDAFPAGSPLRMFAEGISGKEDMLDSILFQQKDSTLFSGTLFQTLGMLSEHSGDGVFDLNLAEFLKAFDGYRSAPSTLVAVKANLESIRRQLPPPYREQLQKAAQKLSSGSAERLSAGPAENPADEKVSPEEKRTAEFSPLPGSVDQDLNVLKKEILPVLSGYISKFNDYGKMREEVSLLLNNVAILNVSTKENLEQQFGKLIAYCKHSLNLPEPALQQLRAECGRVFSAGDADQPKSPLFEALTSLLKQGSRTDTAGFEKTVYQEVCRSLLLDSSVYMPFVHLYLPVSWQGNSMFAQIWVEKKEVAEKKSSAPAAQKGTSVFLTFDIRDLGYFEAAVSLQEKRADIRLNCPPNLVKKSGDIVPDLSKILRQNGFTPGEIRVASSDQPEIPGILLQKIQERKRSINVTV
jgi:hypothetical protein